MSSKLQLQSHSAAVHRIDETFRRYEPAAQANALVVADASEPVVGNGSVPGGFLDGGFDIFDRLQIAQIVPPKIVSALALPSSDGVQGLLHGRRETRIDIPREKTLQHAHHGEGHERRLKRGLGSLLHGSSAFLVPRRPDGHGIHVVFLQRIAPGIQRVQDRGISAGSPDADTLQLLHHACIIEPRRGIRPLALRSCLLQLQSGLLLQAAWQALVARVGGIDPLKSGEERYLPGATELEGAVGRALRRIGLVWKLRRNLDSNLGALDNRICHGGSYRAGPDHCIQLRGVLVDPSNARTEVQPRWTNGLVRFLGVHRPLPRLCTLLQAGLRCDVLFSIVVSHEALEGRGGLGAEHRIVRPHVGDMASFVETLRDTHRPRRLPSEATASGALQSGCDERLRRLHLLLLLVKLRHGEPLLRQPLAEFLRSLHGQEESIPIRPPPATVEVACLDDPLPVHGCQATREWRACGVSRQAQRHSERAKVRGPEHHALPLAVHHELQRHRLYATSAQLRRQRLPQDLRQAKARQAIQKPSGFLRLHKSAIQLPRLLERSFQRRLGDLSEGHALEAVVRRRQQLRQVPADGLSLAVSVGGKNYFLRRLRETLQFSDALRLALRHEVKRLKVLVYVDGQRRPALGLLARGDVGRALGQIAHVAIARHHFIGLFGRVQDLLERARLRRRLYDDQLHCRVQRRSEVAALLAPQSAPPRSSEADGASKVRRKEHQQHSPQHGPLSVSTSARYAPSSTNLEEASCAARH
eukprot:scaffold8448_cov239-Pinguiococcus_pyrenoidosus.AAC.3